MKFLLTTLFAIIIYTSTSSQVSLNFLPVESQPNLASVPEQSRTLDGFIVSSCSEMCKKCNAGKCSSCRGGYSLIGNECVLPTELNGLVIKRYGRYQVFNIDYKGNNTPIEAVGIIFALLILGVTIVFMLKKESIFSSQKQPGQCIPNMSMSQSQSQSQQQPQQGKTPDDKKTPEKGSEEKTDKPEELDKSIEIKGETKKPTDKESRSDFEENTHQDVEKNSEEVRSPPAKDINIVIKMDDLPAATQGKLRRGLSRKEEKSPENSGANVQTVDQEGTVASKQNKNETEKDKKQQKKEEEGNNADSKIDANEQEEKEASVVQKDESRRSEMKSEQQEEQEQEQEVEVEEDQGQEQIEEQGQEQEEIQEEEDVNPPPAPRDRSRPEETSQDRGSQALKTEEALEEEYFENSISDRVRSRNTEEETKAREDQPRRASSKKNEELDKGKTQKPQKASRSEVAFEDTLNRSNHGATDKAADKNYQHTQDIVLTLGDFLDQSAERQQHETEDGNASACGFLAAVTKR